jgi:hypothetical protein
VFLSSFSRHPHDTSSPAKEIVKKLPSDYVNVVNDIKAICLDKLSLKHNLLSTPLLEYAKQSSAPKLPPKQQIEPLKDD